MTGDSDLMLKRNQGFTGIRENKNMKNKLFATITGCLLIVFILEYLYWFQPAIFASFCNIFFPDERYMVQVVINGESHTLPIYIKKRAAKNRKDEITPALILCNLPTPSGVEHLKLFPNGIGVFQTPEQWFIVKNRYVLIMEGSYLTIDLRDDMKGWGTDYKIDNEGDAVVYLIQASQKMGTVKIMIPQKILKSIPPNDIFDQKKR